MPKTDSANLVFLQLPTVGKQFKAGQALGTVESATTAFAVYAPVRGQVVEVNTVGNGQSRASQ